MLGPETFLFGLGLLAPKLDLLLCLASLASTIEDPPDSTSHNRRQSTQETKKSRVCSLGLAQEREQSQGEKGKQPKFNHDGPLEVPHDRRVNLVGLTRVGINDRCGPRTPTTSSSSRVDLLLEVLVIRPVHPQEVARSASSKLPALDVLLFSLAQNVRQALREGISRGCLESLLLGSRNTRPEQAPTDGVLVYPLRRLLALAFNTRTKSLTGSVHKALGSLSAEHRT
jgi:hypothetical protein